MKVYELIRVAKGVEISLGAIFKDEKRAFEERRIQNLRAGANNDIYAPYQVREVSVL